MQIIHEPNRNRFIACAEDGAEVGYVEYSRFSPGLLSADHTAVRKEWEGRGIAMQLLDALAAFARAENLRIRPSCSYVAWRFSRYTEKYGDVTE